MRVFLLGTLSAILLGLLIGAGSLVRARRGHVAVPLPEVPEPDATATTPTAPISRRREPLPAVGAAGCARRPGLACWRGRLRLSPEVVRGWRARRAEEGVVTFAQGGAEEATEEATFGRSGIAADSDPPQDEDDPAGDAVDVSDDPASASEDVPLPPDSGFRAFFVLRLFRTDDGDDTAESDDDGDGDGADGDAASVALHDDGTFEIHAPPGRYGLEAVSRDGYLAGERDNVIAVAGDVEDGLDVVLAATVALSGRVLDEDGVLVPARVTIVPVGGGDTAVTHGDGTFNFDQLTPGAYRLTAALAGNETTATFVAPMENIVLRIARTGAGLLILPTGPDGRCVPPGVLAVASARDTGASAGSPAAADASRHWRRTDATDCQAVIEPIAPGSTWDVIATAIEPRPIEAHVQFGLGAPAAPVCLRAGCSTDAAALRLVAIDVDGREIPATATVVASAPGGPAVGSNVDHLTKGLAANRGLTIEVRAAAMALRRQLWLLPGVNRAVVQFPMRTTRPTESRELLMLR